MALTAQAVANRIRNDFGLGWRDSAVDVFLAGDPDREISGVATTFAPSLDVLRKAVNSGVDMIIVRESPYWGRNTPTGIGPMPVDQGPQNMEDDPTYRAKRDFIATHNLIVYRLFENWNARQPDGQLLGLAKALGWERYYRPSGGMPWATNNGFFDLPPATLRATARSIRERLSIKGIRVGGDPNLRVTRVALSHGMYWLTDLQKLLAEPGVNLIVVGEPEWENELSQYSFDLAAAGIQVGIIVLGQAVSEDPGGGEMAAWLKSFVTEVPVIWIPTGEPVWMPY